jgi:CheY-like chemotaxis protein/nitrogen-specific signal transduction histidine kinase
MKTKPIPKLVKKDKISLKKKFAREIKELSATLTERRNFLANVSHEIRTPLQGVGCILHELVFQWNELSEETRFALIKKAAENSDRLMKASSSLLDLSVMDLGLDSEKKRCDIRELIETVIDEFSETCDITNIDLKIEDDCLYRCIVDPSQITQVLRTLISNALRYGNGAPTHIRLGNSHIVDKDYLDQLIPTIRCSVTDHGPGIPEAELGRIFEPFKKNARTDLQRTNDARLGLSTCKEIINLHGGEMWAKNNEKSAGVTISFTIPHDNAEQNLATLQPAETAVKQPQHKESLNILFADDEDPSIVAATLILKSLGHKVTVAANGLEVMQKLKEGYKDFDLILLDIMMPQMNGLEVLYILRGHPIYKNLPIVMQTGMSDGLGLKHARELGARKEFLQKPFNRQDMVKLLDGIISEAYKKRTVQSTNNNI